MKLEDFLEKKEKRDIQLFRWLVFSGGNMEYTEAAEKLDITKASLETALEEITYFISPLSEKVALDYDGKTIRLRMDPLFSLRELHHFFLRQAVKVRLIDYMFHHHEFSLAQLATALSLSESSLSRKIKDLNHYLEEFGLKIWNGRLQGEELQICYFYYLFYWFVMGRDSVGETAKNDSGRMLQGLENFLHVSFEEENRERVLLWLQVVRNRMMVKKKDVKKLKEKMEPYLEDSLYRKLRSMVWRFSSRYSVEPDEEEAQMLFGFLVSSGVLPESFFHDYRLTRKRTAPVAALDTYAVETIIIQYGFRKLPYMLERKMFHALSQIHSAFYFFEGTIETYEARLFLEQEKKVAEHSFQSFARTLRQIALDKLDIQKREHNRLVEWSLLGYVSVLVMVIFEMRQVLKVGIKLTLFPLYTEAAVPFLKQTIEKVSGVEAEEYRPEKTYDLVITDRRESIRSLPGESEVYVISELFSSFDQKNIERLLLTMKGKRKDR